MGLQDPAPILRAQLRRRFGVEVDEPQARAALAAEIAYYRAHLQEGRDRASLAALRARCAEVLRGALAPAGHLSAISGAALTATLLDSLRFVPYADAGPALGELRQRGVRIVAVSNWDVSLPDVLERARIGELLDGVVTSAAVGSRKPDPAIFRHALDLAGTAPAEALHVGDSFVEDVGGASAAGIAAILLRRDRAAPAPADTRTIRSLAEVTLGFDDEHSAAHGA